MLKIGLSIVIGLFALLGCGSDGEDLTELQSHKWIAEDCKQSQDKNGILHNSWYKYAISFTSDDQMLFNSDVFDDANCTEKVPNVNESNPVVVYSSFLDNGEVEVENGYKVHDIVVESNTLDGKEVIEAKYAINEEGRLCFSQMLYFSECDGPSPASRDFICSTEHMIGYATYLGSSISYDSCFIKE